RDRVTSFVDDEQRVTLRGNTHPLASKRFDFGAVTADFPMEHMLLTLLPESAQEETLKQLLEEQQDITSPYYHQWLTPEQYGERFGISQSDTEQVVAWLQSHGLKVEEVAASRRSIDFSG